MQKSIMNKFLKDGIEIAELNITMLGCVTICALINFLIAYIFIAYNPPPYTSQQAMGLFWLMGTSCMIPVMLISWRDAYVRGKLER